MVCNLPCTAHLATAVSAVAYSPELTDHPAAAAADYSVFVGDLAAGVTDFQLQEVFHAVFPSVRGAKVITDVATGRSKGYGFVRFGDEAERDRALVVMSGKVVASRAIRVSQATAKKSGSSGVAMPGDTMGIMTPGSTGNGTPYGSASSSGTSLSDYEPSQGNTTLFIGGLAPVVTEAELADVFGQHGTIIYTKIPQVGDGCLPSMVNMFSLFRRHDLRADAIAVIAEQGLWLCSVYAPPVRRSS